MGHDPSLRLVRSHLVGCVDTPEHRFRILASPAEQAVRELRAHKMLSLIVCSTLGHVVYGYVGFLMGLQVGVVIDWALE